MKAIILKIIFIKIKNLNTIKNFVISLKKIVFVMFQKRILIYNKY